MPIISSTADLILIISACGGIIITIVRMIKKSRCCENEFETRDVNELQRRNSTIVNNTQLGENAV